MSGSSPASSLSLNVSRPESSNTLTMVSGGRETTGQTGERRHHAEQHFAGGQRRLKEVDVASSPPSPARLEIAVPGSNWGKLSAVSCELLSGSVSIATAGAVLNSARAAASAKNISDRNVSGWLIKPSIEFSLSLSDLGFNKQAASPSVRIEGWARPPGR